MIHWAVESNHYFRYWHRNKNLIESKKSYIERERKPIFQDPRPTFSTNLKVHKGKYLNSRPYGFLQEDYNSSPWAVLWWAKRFKLWLKKPWHINLSSKKSKQKRLLSSLEK